LKRIERIVAVAALAGVAACATEKSEDVAAAEAAAGRPEVAEQGSGNDPAAALPSPETVEVEGVGTCRRVGEDLLFAGQPSPDALRALAAAGYRTVVNTRGEGELDWDEEALAAELGMSYVAIPMAYPIESIPDDWLQRFDQIMEEADRPILLHCSSGNRVAGLWAVWLAERRHVPVETALDLGKRAGMTRIAPVVEQRLESAGG